MELEFDRINKSPILNIGDIKNNVQSCKISSVSHNDRYVFGVDIDYMDDKKERLKVGHIGRSISYDVVHKEGMTTVAWTYPIDPFISKDEIIGLMLVIPYNNVKTGNLEPATLELKKQVIKRGRFEIDDFPLLSFK